MHFIIAISKCHRDWWSDRWSLFFTNKSQYWWLYSWNLSTTPKLGLAISITMPRIAAMKQNWFRFPYSFLIDATRRRLQAGASLGFPQSLSRTSNRACCLRFIYTLLLFCCSVIQPVFMADIVSSVVYIVAILDHHPRAIIPERLIKKKR